MNRGSVTGHARSRQATTDHRRGRARVRAQRLLQLARVGHRARGRHRQRHHLSLLQDEGRDPRHALPREDGGLRGRGEGGATAARTPRSWWQTSPSRESPAMEFDTLVLAREESFAVVTLTRPPANAISEPLIRELNEALNSVRDDDSVRSVIITGAGDKIFCGGADLGSAFSGGDIEAFIRFGNSVMRKIERFPKPVIAAINGHAMGGGMEISMACHFRLMKETARMGQTESNLGIIPGYGVSQRLPRLIG